LIEDRLFLFFFFFFVFFFFPRALLLLLLSRERATLSARSFVEERREQSHQASDVQKATQKLSFFSKIFVFP
jgi:hypothetical protein